MGIGIRFGLGPVSIGAGTSFRSRRRRSNGSGDSDWGELLLYLFIAAVVFLLVLISIAGIIGYLFGLVYLAARPDRRRPPTMSGGDIVGTAFLIFAGLVGLFAVGVDIGAVIYFLNEGATLSPKDITLVGLAAGVPLTAFSAFCFYRAFEFANGSLPGVRILGWGVSAIVTFGVPFTVAAWTIPHGNDGEDVNPWTIFFCLVVVGGFIAAQFLVHKTDVAEDIESEGKAEQLSEVGSGVSTTAADENEDKEELLQRLADLLSQRLSKGSTTVADEGEAGQLSKVLKDASPFVRGTVFVASILMVWPEKHKGLTLLLVPTLTSGISIVIGFRLGALPFQS